MTESATALLLTGRPGIGKTTVVRKVADRLAEAGVRVGGFYTEEMREGGSRRGFRLVSLGAGPAESRVMSHVDLPKTVRVGKYGVDVEAVDAAVEEMLAGAAGSEAYIVDEIGKMECASERFVAAIQRLLGGELPLVATIAKRGGGFIAEVKSRPDVRVEEVTRGNRDDLPDHVAAWVRERIARDSPQ